MPPATNLRDTIFHYEEHSTRQLKLFLTIIKFTCCQFERGARAECLDPVGIIHSSRCSNRAITLINQATVKYLNNRYNN